MGANFHNFYELTCFHEIKNCKNYVGNKHVYFDKK